MYIKERSNGQIRTDRLDLDPCTTEDLIRFHDPEDAAVSSIDYFKKYKPL